MSNLFDHPPLPDSDRQLTVIPPPVLIAAAGRHAARRFLEFFAVTMHNGVLVPNVLKVTARNPSVFNMLCEALTVGGRFQPEILRYDWVRISAGFSAPSTRRSLKSVEIGADRRPGPRQSLPEPHI